MPYVSYATDLTQVVCMQGICATLCAISQALLFIFNRIILSTMAYTSDIDTQRKE